MRADSPNQRGARPGYGENCCPKCCPKFLALAIDPETESRLIGVRPIRKIKFENPSKGHASRWRRDHIIADFIRQHVGPGHSLEAAYEKAKARFHISRSVAQAIWQQHLADMKDAEERNLAGL
jgi:hypothetical protein